jgi:serine/threonine protein kinase
VPLTFKGYCVSSSQTENKIVSLNLVPKLPDFGLCHLLNTDSLMTALDGSLQYKAPEGFSVKRCDGRLNNVWCNRVLMSTQRCCAKAQLSDIHLKRAYRRIRRCWCDRVLEQGIASADGLNWAPNHTHLSMHGSFLWIMYEILFRTFVHTARKIDFCSGRLINGVPP